MPDSGSLWPNNKPAMNAHIQSAAKNVISLYETHRLDMAKQASAELLDLAHECESQRLQDSFSVRTGAEIIRAAAVLELAARGIKA